MIKRCQCPVRIVVLVVIFNLICKLQSQSCTLNDLGKTPGDCTSIRDCKYQIGRLRVGAPVTRCGGNNVCCPKGLSVAEKMCMKWTEMLYAPTSFDQPRLREPQCGHGAALRQFIVGGRDAHPFEYPHAVALGYGTDQNKLKFLCGATLISDRFLLSAGHCITTKNIGKPSYAVLGDNTLDPRKQGPGNGKPSVYRKLVKIGSVTVHPEYKPPLIYHDIAIIQLATPVELDRFILPACVGTPTKTPKQNVFVEASGWGITDAAAATSSNHLQAVNISTIHLTTCNQVYGLDPDKGFRYPQGIIKSQTCASGNDKDTCRGDSGGGLYIRERPCVFHLIGITSIGRKVCGYGEPAVYTTVASYQDWIESIVWGDGGGNRG